jgi:hypothetical protein
MEKKKRVYRKYSSEEEFLIARRAMARRWKANNKEKHKAYRKEYYAKNKEKERQTNEAWKKDNKETYKEIKRKADAVYRINNTEKLRQYHKENRHNTNKRIKERYHSDEDTAMRMRLRASLTQALRLADVKKTITTFELIGIPIQEFKKYIEGKFLPGMSWGNRKEWHIDHHRPCASFDLTKIEQQRVCFHYTNLRPLWREDNQKKGSLYNGKRYTYKNRQRNEDSIILEKNKGFLPVTH